jgi:hypothetical protein
MKRGKTVRNALAAAGIALIAAPAAFAFLSEASHDRTAAFLEEVRAAQDRVRYAGRKIVENPDGATVLDLRADRPGRVHVEVVSRPEGRRAGSWPGRGARGRFSDPALIAENYRLELLARESLAGRDAERYALLPRRPGRASYEFAVDRQNRFILAFRAVTADGKRLYDGRFESIAFDPPPPAEEKPAKPAVNRPAQERPHRVVRSRVTEKELRGAMDFTVWQPRWVPPGFKPRTLEWYKIPNMGEAVLARWSDGMVGIHVIQTAADNPSWELFRGAYLGLPESPPSSASGGPVAWRMRHPGGALLDLTLEGTEVLIGGQIDPDELKKMADHLRNIQD